MCERAGGLRLRAGCRFACFYRFVSLSRLRSFAIVSPAIRVFLSCLVFFLLTGSGLGGRRRAPSSFRPVFPVPCVSYCVLASRPVLSVGFGLIVAPASRPLYSARIPSCLPPSRSLVCLLRPSRFHGDLVAVLPRSALLPVLLVVGRGGLECRSSWSLVPRRLVRLAPRLVAIACFPASVSCVALRLSMDVWRVSCLRVACLNMIIAPLLDMRDGAIFFPCRLFFLVRFYSSMMA